MKAPAALLLFLCGAAACAQARLSQGRLEDDCLQRLRPLVPREAKVQAVDFSALGSNVAYYVVSYRFSADLGHGRRTAACTYRRDGEWVRDDAAAWKFSRELETSRRR